MDTDLISKIVSVGWVILSLFMFVLGYFIIKESIVVFLFIAGGMFMYLFLKETPKFCQTSEENKT